MFNKIVNVYFERRQRGDRGGGPGIEIKKQIGKRFAVFRKAIGKTRVQLARELKVKPATITNIEMGKSYPHIHYINYLHRHYRLNSNWLLGGNVPMFLQGIREGKKGGAFLPCHVTYHDPRYSVYVKLVRLMKEPAVERSILNEAARVKLNLKNKLKP
ncbi:MAG: helix-turn-helix transcriptional regulator [Candidatus Aminicenantes bacterium]|nr:MAG: helix-turn-helix transcriptional regulator [Candidatus Aminicenantes bacterium]